MNPLFCIFVVSALLSASAQSLNTVNDTSAVVGSAPEKSTGLKIEDIPDSTLSPAAMSDSAGATEVIGEKAPTFPAANPTPSVLQNQGSISEERVRRPEPSLRSTSASADLQYTRDLSRRGSTQMIVGLVLSYGVAMPLSFAATANQDIALSIVSLGFDMAGTGFLVAGPLRSGIAASMTYDYSKRYHLGLDKNINWTFYRLGWAFSAVGAGLSAINTIAGTDATIEVALLSSVFSIVAQAMFITSTANSASYTRKALESLHAGRIMISPTYSSNNKTLGLKMGYLF